MLLIVFGIDVVGCDGYGVERCCVVVGEYVGFYFGVVEFEGEV